MRFWTNRAVRGCAAIFIIGISLSGCDNKDEEQRKAFTAYLQQHIVDMPLMTAPPLTPEERQSLTSYTNDYQIMSDYGIETQRIMMDWDRHFSLMKNVYTAQRLLDYREELAALLKDQQTIAVLLEQLHSRARAQKARLHVEGDLITTFQHAFDKTVTRPHKIISRVVAATGQILTQEINIADFIKAKNARIEGPQGKYAIFADHRDQLEYSKKIKALVASMEELSAAGRQIQEAAGITSFSDAGEAK